MKNQIQIGWVVLLGDEAMRLYRYRYNTDDPRVLIIGSGAKVFRSKRKAQRAIKRTKAYAAKYKLPWDSNYSIMPVYLSL